MLPPREPYTFVLNAADTATSHYVKTFASSDKFELLNQVAEYLVELKGQMPKWRFLDLQMDAVLTTPTGLDFPFQPNPEEVGYELFHRLRLG